MVDRNVEVKGDDPLVELSVSGTSFTVRKELLTEHDWVLSRIVENDIPWALHHNRRYFLGQDPVAFRWVLHYTRCNSLPMGILASVDELEVIRTLADFLCFQPLIDYVDEAVGKCMETRGRVEELETEIVTLKETHLNALATLKCFQEKELATMKEAHRMEVAPLKKLEEKLDAMDGVSFHCDKIDDVWSGDRGYRSYGAAYTGMVVMWRADSKGIDWSRLTCPQCQRGADKHRYKQSFLGTRGKSTTTTFWKNI